MNKLETSALLTIAIDYAENAYKETFLKLPDYSQEQDRLILDTITQAWLTGYNYLRNDIDLSRVICDKFGFYINEEDY